MSFAERGCLEPAAGADMTVVHTSLSPSATATFTCVGGYSFTDDAVEQFSTCEYNAFDDTVSWTPMLVTCAGKQATTNYPIAFV